MVIDWWVRSAVAIFVGVIAACAANILVHTVNAAVDFARKRIRR